MMLHEPEWMKDDVFKNFVYSRRLDIDLNKLKEEILIESKATSGEMKSNRGGWQGHVAYKQDKPKLSEFFRLFEVVEESANFVFESERLDYVANKIHGWANINHSGDYNVLHCHAAAALSCVFYVSLPESESNSLQFLRTDGAAYLEPYTKFSVFSPKVSVGRLFLFSPHLFHHVLKNKTNEERISVAFNVE